MYNFGENCSYYSVLDIINHSYKILFYSMPCRNCQKNNNSSLMHRNVVVSAISDLINQGLIKQCSSDIHAVNPHSLFSALQQ